MIEFAKRTVATRFGDPRRNFELVDLTTEIRTCPLLGIRMRITPQRVIGEQLRIADWPDLTEPVAASYDQCPFCPEVIDERACALDEARFGEKFMRRGAAFLFPNLAPYGPHSAVTVIGPDHYTEVGAYDAGELLDAFDLSAQYLRRVRAIDPSIHFGAITQNHLPASGGTLVHPHLQVQADVDGPSFPAALRARQIAASAKLGEPFWPALVRHEKATGERYVGRTGRWNWLHMFAPQGYLETWGVAEVPATFDAFDRALAAEFVDGLLRLQTWYRSRNRNSFNLAIYLSEPADGSVHLTARLLARGNWMRYARNDRSFFEVVLGEQVTDQRPEDWAAESRSFFEKG
jgi:UDPglucose--hexose-1-phosphate uridylyltransferase